LNQGFSTSWIRDLNLLIISNANEKPGVNDQPAVYESRLQQISDSSLALLYILVRRPDGTYFYEHLSRAVETIYEVSADQGMADANALWQRIHPHDQPGHQEASCQSYETLQPFQHEWRILSPTGAVKWVRAYSQPQRREQGEVVWYGVLIDITRRKKLETQLLEQESFLRSIYEGVATGIFVVDVTPTGEFRYVSFNPANHALTGLSVDIYGKTPAEAQLPSAVTEHYLECVISGFPISYEESFPWQGQDTLWYTTLNPLRDPEGRIHRIVGTTINVNPIKQAERAAQAAKDRLNSILNSSLDGIIQFCTIRNSSGAIIDFTFLLCNPAAYQLLGRSEADLIGAKMLDQFPGIRKLGLFDKIVAVVESNQSLREDFFYGHDKLNAWYEMSVVKFADGIVITFRNITELKQAQASLEQLNQDLNHLVEERTNALRIQMEQEMILRNIIQTIHSSLDFEEVLTTLLAETHRILTVDHILAYQFNPELELNPELEPSGGKLRCLVESARTNSSPVNLNTLSADWIALFQQRSLDEAQDPVPDPHQDFGILWFGQVLVIKDRHTPPVGIPAALLQQIPAVACIMAPIMSDGSPWGLLVVYSYQARDWQGWEMKLLQQLSLQTAIALRQSQLYEAAQAQVRELEHLNRLKDDFLSTVSHELRTPMANIKMATTLLEIGLVQQGLLQDPESRLNRHFTVLKQECQREIQLINDLLELSRLQSALDSDTLHWIDLQTFLPQLAEPFHERAQQQGQQLQLHLETALPVIQTHSPYLERILQELLQNACKYTPAGETITLAADTKDGILSFSVTNTGIEIAPTEQAKVFERFYRIMADDRWKHGGTGLGLALAQELTQRLGGTIHVASAAGWTRFTVEWPLSVLVPSQREQGGIPHKAT
jgi:PAS domain S-box-containing protein